MAVTIREAVSDDARALLALERASPEVGFFTVGVEPHVDHFTLAARYPNSRGYVAVVDGAIVGVVFASVAPTQVNGAVVPGAYLSVLRVHPVHRRRGIATRLLGHAWERAREEDAAAVAWGVAMARNAASIGACHRAGFTQERALVARVLLPLPGPAPRSGLGWRQDRADDLRDFATALHARYAQHQLWRPTTAEELTRSGRLLPPPIERTFLGTDPGGTIVAGATVVAFYRLATLRIRGIAPLPAALNRVLRPMLGLVPLRPVLIHRALLPADNPAAVQALLHRAARPFGLTVVPVLVLDPRDPAWPAVRRYPGLTVRLRALARSAQPLDNDRLWQID